MEQRYAAIDIGSNGIRLLLSKVITTGEHCVFTKESLVRMPIRLGADVFSHKAISTVLEDKLVFTMQGYAQLIKAYNPVAHRACATSAMRESSNGLSIAERIRRESGLDLEIIDGGQEAEIIFASHIAESLDPDHAYLYIDVGGGSTELTLFSQNQRVASRSFPVGTVRILSKQVKRSSWDEMKSWVISNMSEGLRINAIGSGGNMNKLFRLSGKATGEPVNYETLLDIDNLLNTYTIEERIRILSLRPDRADVIIPASKIFRSIMKWGNIKQIYVPQFGLVDGLVHVMHDELIRKVDAQSN
ncbi:MAG: exopolyphosphatase [Candidatus Marinimicrobia bacterium]|nr:exopolyphosphatase [Candidatus Neomarinimicrobiota bacterium]